jgi:hypothetical protein
MEPIRVQGRTLSAEDLSWLRELLAQQPRWHRTALSRHVCEVWNWRNDAGRLKDMAARTLLLKLEHRGLLQLPLRRGPIPNGARRTPDRDGDLGVASPPVTGPLRTLQPLTLTPAHTPAQRQRLIHLLRQYHYLGLGRPVGENLGYLITDAQKRLLAAAWFGAPAWKAAARDAFIGWSAAQREKGLPLLANNSRLLLLPWVRVPHLASHLLGLLARRISADWQAKYGHRLVLLETYVQRDRFAGTCYHAANWTAVGDTTGRSRQDRHRQLRVPIKSILLFPLRPDWRAVLHGNTPS